MKWNLPSILPDSEKEVLVFCINDGLTFYDVDWWSKTRECFVGSHCDGFEVLAWAKIEEPPQEIMEVKNTDNQQLKAEISALMLALSKYPNDQLFTKHSISKWLRILSAI